MTREDMMLIGLRPGAPPRIGDDVLCLAVICIRENGPTANLLAPVVVNLRNRQSVQAVAPSSRYSHRHPLNDRQPSSGRIAARKARPCSAMLARKGDVILIGDDIEIVISGISRSKVKVGIRAPREIPVVAREVKLVREENAAAAALAPEEISGRCLRLLRKRADEVTVPARRRS